MIREEDVREITDKLPETADELALLLNEEGFLGWRNNAFHDPLARYIDSQIFRDEFRHPPIAIRRVQESETLNKLSVVLYWERIPYHTPSVIAEFVNRFDAGEWPELVDPTYPGVFG